MNASAVSIVVLATSLRTGNYSYYYDRAVPMQETWAKKWELELAFGTNVFDADFLKECGRLLKVKRPQVPPRDALDIFQCDQLRILWFANCTGEYMGLGPVCRCQETMRYWLTAKRFARTKWYIFMDDDVFFRPEALLAFLDGFDEEKPIAFVGAHGPRGLSLTKDRWRACGDLCAYRFPWAQPAILSRGALLKMKPFLDQNFMTESQRVWFGTHDVILGLALWWASIPILSMAKLTLSKNPRGINNKHLQNSRFGLYQHVVRGSGDLTAKFLMDTLHDDHTSAKAAGVLARSYLSFYPNDGAAHINPSLHQNLSHLFLHPDVCATNASAFLDATADRRPPNACGFTTFDYASSPLRRFSSSSSAEVLVAADDDDDAVTTSSGTRPLVSSSSLAAPSTSLQRNESSQKWTKHILGGGGGGPPHRRRRHPSPAAAAVLVDDNSQSRSRERIYRSGG